MSTRTAFANGALALVLALLAPPSRAVEPAKLPADPRLSVALTTDQAFNGVALTGDGRLFMPVQRTSPDRGIEVGEARDGKLQPYPDEAWNGWSDGGDVTKAFVGVNALRIGPDGLLWIVDSGIPAKGDKTIKGAVKVVVVDLASNTVKRVYPLDAGTSPDSFVDDIRFNGRHAYLSDAGEKHAGLIVLDLDSGVQRRLLDGDSRVTQNGRVLSAEGRPLITPEGKPKVVNADQLEVSPDGKTFYFQACTGPLYRIDTRLLDDPKATPADVATGVSLYADTHSTGGSAIAADGTIYISDTDHSAVLKIAPGGAISTLVQDPKLDWIDAMWIDDRGDLWLPAAQMNRRARMNAGRNDVQLPYTLYTMPIGAKPVLR